MNPDLAQERRRATFDPEQVTSLLYRGPENVRKRRYLRTYSVYVLLTRLYFPLYATRLWAGGREGMLHVVFIGVRIEGGGGLSLPTFFAK